MKKIQANNQIQEIYFDYDRLNYLTGARPTGEQVMDAAAKGGHGAEGLRVMRGNVGYSVWDDPVYVLDARAFDILKKMLISEGIPIK